METAPPRPVQPSRVTGAQLSGDLERALWALRAYDTTALATLSLDGPHVAGAYFAPQRHGDGLRLLLAILRESHTQLGIAADPRVAFMCSPGNPSRWIQGSGRAALVDDAEQYHELSMRLIDHAAGARFFVENFAVVPVVLSIERLKVVEDAGKPPLLLDLSGTS